MKDYKVPWHLVIILCATATASYICRVNISTAAPLIMKEFHLSQIQMGRIFSALILGYALFQAPAGALADRWGARRVLTVSLWLWILFTVLQVFVNTGPFTVSAQVALTSFIIIRFLLGITESPTYPASAQGVSKWILPRFQGLANGIVIASIGIGSAIAPIIVSKIMVHWGWRLSIIASALPAFLVVLFWKFVKEPLQVNYLENKQAENISSQGNFKRFNFLNRSFIFLTLSYTLQGYVGYIFVTWFYLYLVQVRHFDLLTGALMSSMPWVLSIISIPLGGLISDYLSRNKKSFGQKIIPIFGMVMSGILISFGAHTTNAVFAAISLAFATAFVLCVESPFWTMMLRVSGAKSGTAGGIMNMGSNIGGFISPFLTPIIANYLGWENALYVAAVIAIVAALLWLGIKSEIEDNTL
jgi:MFS transporter, ACS family, glucarate transporter